MDIYKQYSNKENKTFVFSIRECLVATRLCPCENLEIERVKFVREQTF